MNNPKRIFEPIDVEQLLRGWLIHAHRGRDRHDRAARRCDGIRLWLGGCAAVFSAAVGTSVFAALEKQTSNISIQVSVSVAAILSAILTGLGTFLNLSERAEKHRFAGVRYKEVIRELERILSVSVSSVGNADPTVAAIQNRLDQLEESAPVVPEALYTRIEDEWKNQSFDFVEKAVDLYKSNERPPSG